MPTYFNFWTLSWIVGCSMHYCTVGSNFLCRVIQVLTDDRCVHRHSCCYAVEYMWASASIPTSKLKWMAQSSITSGRSDEPWSSLLFSSMFWLPSALLWVGHLCTLRSSETGKVCGPYIWSWTVCEHSIWRRVSQPPPAPVSQTYIW